MKIRSRSHTSTSNPCIPCHAPAAPVSRRALQRAARAWGEGGTWAAMSTAYVWHLRSPGEITTTALHPRQALHTHAIPLGG